MKTLTARLVAALLLLGATLASSPPVRASDHADPLHLTDPNSNITGLFIFPKGDQYILIFNVRKSLVGPKPYELSPYEYVVHFDLTSPMTFTSEEDRKRYGGTVVTPETIHDDATITVRLNDDTTLKGVTYSGLANSDAIRTFTGVRDDPFIFPRFFGVNVIVVALLQGQPSVHLAARSDAQGGFSFALPRTGTWLIKSVHMVRASFFSSEDWDSLWASLTFEIREPHP